MGSITVTYQGPPGLAGRFVSYLEAEGAEVDWEPPIEQRDLSAAVAAVTITLAVRGTNALVDAAVRKFRERWPATEIDWREGDAYR